MIEGIAAIGRSVLNDERGNDRFLAALSLPVRARGDSVPKLAILRYTRDGAQPGRIEAEWHELGPEEYEAWESRILWIGNNKGNKPQDRVTTTNLGYLIGQAIPTLAGKLPEKSALRAVCKAVLRGTRPSTKSTLAERVARSRISCASLYASAKSSANLRALTAGAMASTSSPPA
jgi:hypothetical protein